MPAIIATFFLPADFSWLSLTFAGDDCFVDTNSDFDLPIAIMDQTISHAMDDQRGGHIVSDGWRCAGRGQPQPR
jgi:hypothetical protein